MKKHVELIRDLSILGIFLPLFMFVALVPFAGAQQKETVNLDGSTTVGPIAKAFAEYYMALNPKVNVVVSESGSGNGAKSLVNNACDIANMSRPMKDKEFSAAVNRGIQPTAHVVALDGIAMVVHPSNPVSALSVDQVKDIYLGRITNWKELGGANMPIVKVTRDTNSGTFETFEKLVMDKAKLDSSCEVVGSNGAARQRVLSTPNGIAYVGLAFLEGVKGLEVNGVFPEKATVVSGAYPISRPLYMYTNQYPKLGSHVYRFVTLHLTQKGQEIVEDLGFVPLTNY